MRSDTVENTYRYHYSPEDLDIKFKVNDIFKSIQGESSSAGFPTTFVRLYGCNLKCSYCDQPQESYREMTIRDILTEVKRLELYRVCLTGGEPLIQKNWIALAYLLSKNFLQVTIETNGCCKIPYLPVRNFHFIMDVKTPSSGERGKNLYSNLVNLNNKDEVKFVVKDEEDLDFFSKFFHNFFHIFNRRDIDGNAPLLLVSPVIEDGLDKKWAQRVADFITDFPIPLDQTVRVQVQLHKVLGVK